MEPPSGVSSMMMRLRAEILVLLGATAAQALVGDEVRVTRDHGRPIDSTLAPLVLVTIHPSAVLRSRDRAARDAALAGFDRRLAGGGSPGRLTGVGLLRFEGMYPVQWSSFGSISSRQRLYTAAGGRGAPVYHWLAFIHLVGLVLFVFGHGASAFATFQIRTLRDPLSSAAT